MYIIPVLPPSTSVSQGSGNERVAHFLSGPVGHPLSLVNELCVLNSYREPFREKP